MHYLYESTIGQKSHHNKINCLLWVYFFKSWPSFFIIAVLILYYIIKFVTDSHIYFTHIFEKKLIHQ